MGHFGVVGVGVINRVVLTLRNIGGEWLTVIAVFQPHFIRVALFSPPGLAFLLPLLNDLTQKGIGAGGVIRWVRKRQDSLIIAVGETRHGAQFGVLQVQLQTLAVFLAFGFLFGGQWLGRFFGE